MTFDEVKTDTLNLRAAPAFKATLKAVAVAVADAEHRSMVNMLVAGQLLFELKQGTSS